ncbi:MAG: sugar kinase [Armatimonadetes bacterium]|nr:sugar kinase [Armatimonadota bacterium]
MPLDIIAVGEALLEVMRTRVDDPLDRASEFVGPFPSGAPAIFADQAARLGAKVGFIGAVGDDDFGTCQLDRLQADGLDVSLCPRVLDRATGVAFVTYFSDGNRRFLYHIAHAAAGQMPELKADYFAGVKFLHICGSSLSVSEEMREKCYQAVGLTKAAGGRVSFDPNLRPELLGGEEALRRVCGPVVEASYVVLPSGSEAELLTGVSGAAKACQALLRMGPEVVALKRGAEGCTVITKDQQLEAPAFRVEAVDPTGAGDCFDAGFVVGLLEGLPLEEVGRLANACGALGATRKGPMEGAFRRDAVEEFMTTDRAST